ncbi:MAG TPA: hypothetical protein VGL91_23640 [Acidobacteriota bacterium]|jgi:hypothetical protein
MKAQSFKVSAALAIVVLLAVAFVSAQTATKATIPFQFKAGSSTFPAGEYTVDRIALGNSLLMIQSADCDRSAVVLTIAVSGNPDKSRLVFHRYGDQYFLSQIWKAGSDGGRELLKSRAERELEKSMRERATVVIFTDRSLDAETAR